MKITHFSKSVVGLVRSANEDYIQDFTTKDNTRIFIVCDGMGGHVGGAKASQTAARSIIEYFNGNPDKIIQNALKESIEFANIQIYAEAQNNPDLTGMGTTCVVLAERQGLIYIGHVGDSRCYIYSDKKLHRLTKDHSYVQTLVDKGEITDDEMESHPRKNELTKAIGISSKVDVEIISQPILAKKGDKFLLCSDGLTGLVNDITISKTLESNQDLSQSINKLIKLAEDGGGHDNISADLIEILNSDHKSSRFVSKSNSSLFATEIKQESKGFKLSKNYMILIIAVLVIIVGGLIFKINDGETQTHLPTGPNTVKFDSVVYKYNGTEDRGEFHSEFMKKVKNDPKNKPGEYEKDFPVYFSNKTEKYISIHEYRKLYDEDEEFEKNGDYLMILIKDSIQIDHPKNKSYKEESQVSDENADGIPSSFNQGEIEEKKRKERINRRNREKQDSIERAKKKQDSIKKEKKKKKKKRLSRSDIAIKKHKIKILKEKRETIEKDSTKNQKDKLNMEKKINDSIKILEKELKENKNVTN